MPNINLSILNQKSTPAFFADTLANRPAPSFVGRVFISTDTFDLYRDTGSAWDLLSPSAAAGVTGTGVANQVAFWNGTTAITGENNLWWDSTNDHFGINTNTPGTALDVHHNQNTILQLNQTTLGNQTRIAYQENGTSKWRSGVINSNNQFFIEDVTGGLYPFVIDNTTGQTFIGKNSSFSGSGVLVVESDLSDNHLQIVGQNAPSVRISDFSTGANQMIGIGLSTNTNNFIQGSINGNMCIFNANLTASPILFGIWNGTNTQEAARISASRNFLLGQTTDTGQKFQVTGSAAITGISSFSNTGAFVGFPGVTITQGSGTGIALSITKAGNNEGLYVNKTSGTGNAATIIGTLSATTLVKSGGTSSQILAADGSVITAGTGISISAGQISATSSGGITGSGTAGYIPRFTGTSAIGNSTIRDDGSYAAIGTAPSFNYQFNFGGFFNVGITTNNIGLKFAGTGQYIDANLRDSSLSNRFKIYDSSATSGKRILSIQSDSSGFSGSSIQLNDNASNTNYKFAEFGYDPVSNYAYVNVNQNGSSNPNGLRLQTLGQTRAYFDGLGNMVIDSSASQFFPVGTLYLPNITGVPSGTPTSFTGKSPMFIDSTNNRIYVYVNGSWRYSALI